MKTSTTEVNNPRESHNKKIGISISTGVLVLIWHLGAVALNKPFILPTPLETLKAAGILLKDLDFFKALVGTLSRVLIVTFISTCLGILMGMLSGKFRFIDYLLAPLMLLIKTIPTIVLIVYVVLWMSGYWAPVFVTVLITFPVIYGNVLEGYRNIDKKLLEMAHVFRLSRFKTLSQITIPSIKPYIQSGVLTIASLSLKVVIASEVLSQTKDSMGRSFQIARINIETQTVLALALVTVGLALVLEYVSRWLLGRMK